jgi:hypothetical protein
MGRVLSHLLRLKVQLLGCASPSLCSLDETTYPLFAAGNTYRPWQKQDPAHRGKCPLRSPTHHAPSARETTGLHQMNALGQALRLFSLVWLAAIVVTSVAFGFAVWPHLLAGLLLMTAFLFSATHAPPFGPDGLACFLLVVVQLELFRRQAGSVEPAVSPNPPSVQRKDSYVYYIAQYR